MGGEHIVRAFDRDLNRLVKLIAGMGELAESQLVLATELLEVHDRSLCEQVLETDAKLDSMADEVNLLAVQLLARRQPMAIDLRNILCALKIATELERVGDYAAGIARHMIGVDLGAVQTILQPIQRMGNLAKAMLTDTMQAYGLLNVGKAIEVWQRDRDINEIYTGLLRQFRMYVEKGPDNIESLTSMLFIARCLERIGDHIKNVDEHIYFLVNGEIYSKNVASN